MDLKQTGSNNNSANDPQQAADKKDTFIVKPPHIALPTGGGSIKSIEEKFSVNAVNGTSSFIIPLPVASARNFAPSVELSYSSGNGNGSFGMGWSLAVPSIRRKTQKELPQYLDALNSDTYLIGESEDLVPEFKKDNAGKFIKNVSGNCVLNIYDSPDHLYSILSFRPRTEGLFSRIEQWTEKSSGYIHWRVISGENITSVFGKSKTTRIADPSNDHKIYQWNLEFTYDDKGNCARYDYIAENNDGLNASLLHNKNRVNGNSVFTNLYLKKVLYGNVTPYKTGGDPIPSNFMFETTFDYGEHDNTVPFNPVNKWDYRPDAFSFYKAGFEIRCCRLCKRVLLYHHFSELPGGSALVKALFFNYDNSGKDQFSFLKSATITGYTKHDDGSYTDRSFPPFDFSYHVPEWNTEVKEMSREDLVNSPVGIDGSRYQFIDLYGEGLPGILSEDQGAWFYKSNLGDAHFTPATAVMSKPSFTGLNEKLQLTELGSDGVKQLVSWDNDPKGYFEFSADEGWQPFVPFQSIPRIDFRDPNMKLIDLDGDGIPDILITDTDVYTWYGSRGREGFAASKKVTASFDEENGPSLIFVDRTQTIFLADMSGDGLMDIVRIRNRETCYWPNIGYGKFGARVSMDSPPSFDYDELFNPAMLRIADITGSGLSDIIYTGNDAVQIWLNCQGNRFAESITIDNFPGLTNLSRISITDFLANGTSCIVWSSPLPSDQHNCIRYIDLFQNKKPYLLSGYKNNMGEDTEIFYMASTYYYIKDKLAGTPWITSLHFPVQCVSKLVTYDRIMKTRLAIQYEYHHGYYDHYEREFRGFGRVDQYDAETITHFIEQGGGQAVIEQDLHQNPVLSKTWFHNGSAMDLEKIMSRYANEYFNNPSISEKRLDVPDLPAGLSHREWREALRVCKGKLLRKEVYVLDDGPDADKPYSTEQHNYTVKLLQPLDSNKHAVFLVHQNESVSYHYERVMNDPRISHSFNTEIDNFGNVRKSVAVAYPRRMNPLPASEQMQLHIVYSENDFTDPVNLPLDYRVPMTWQAKAFEITLTNTPVDYFSLEDISSICSAAGFVDYNEAPGIGTKKRLLSWTRTQFRDDDAVTLMPFGKSGSKGLRDQTYKAAFNKVQLSDTFNTKITPALLEPLLIDKAKGGYVFIDNYYWVQSGLVKYDDLHFYLPVEYTDSFGNKTLVEYDSKYHLYVSKVTDALNNVNEIINFNFRALMATVSKDVNFNISAVRVDEMGLVTKTFNIGKKGIDKGDEYDDTKIETKGAIDFPGTELEYHLNEWYDQSKSLGFDINNYKPKPNYAKTKKRETHYHADAMHNTRWMESYAYSAGNGKVILMKSQAEPGMALQVNPNGTVISIDTSPSLRWIGNGRIIVNNKGNAVKQYEAYFSVSPSFDDEKEMVKLGVTPVIHYDAFGRVERTDHPNGTFSKTTFTPWMEKLYDPNDTVKDSQWYIDLGSPVSTDPPPADPSKRAAWLSAQHYDTPVTWYFDSLGRKFLMAADNKTETIESRTVLDIEENALEVKDALGRVAVKNTFAMGGMPLKQWHMDSGNRWMIPDAGGKPLLNWNDRGHEFSFNYDELERPFKAFVKESNNTILFSLTEYGESLLPADARSRNLRGQVHIHYDQSGIAINVQNDFKGNSLVSQRRLAKPLHNIDWSSIPSVVMENEIFEKKVEYDGFNRPRMMTTPHTATMKHSEFLPTYSEAGLMQKMEISIRAAAAKTSFVKAISYNAKGQREEIRYGNGTITKYTYDKQGFRLLRLLTTRNPGAVAVQDLNYIYDATGNIVEIRDDSQPDIFFDGEQVKPINKYEFDAVYRLISATGRKHAGQTDIHTGAANTGTESPYHPFINSNAISPSDLNAFCNYTEKYQYDKMGNMLQQKHISNKSPWTRNFEYAKGTGLNNQLTSTNVGADTWKYNFDAHGNMEELETIVNSQWDFMDRFVQVGLGGGGAAHYIYDYTGQRARKVIVRADGSKKERIYLGSLEIYRETNNSGTVTLERESLMVTDDLGKIAMVDTPVIKPGGSTETELIRYNYGNHLQSSSLELDDNAAMISREEFFPFGTTSFHMTDSAREVAAKRFRYTGKERDEETGLNYHGARYYVPWLCRWSSVDPIEHDNPYIYVSNNPVLLFDPDGKDDECGPGPTICAANKAKKPEITQAQVALFLEKEIGRMGGGGCRANETFPQLVQRYYQVKMDYEEKHAYKGPEWRQGQAGDIENARARMAAQAAAWQNLQMMTSDPLATIMVLPSIVQGVDPVTLNQRLRLASNVSGMAVGVAGIGQGRANFQAVTKSPENSPGKPVAADVRENKPAAPATNAPAPKPAPKPPAPAAPPAAVKPAAAPKPPPGQLSLPGIDAPPAGGNTGGTPSPKQYGPPKPPVPPMSVVEIKPDTPKTVAEGWKQAGNRSKYTGDALDQGGNMGLATYNRTTGEVYLEVREAAGFQNTLYRMKIGQLTPQQLANFKGDTTAFGNYVESIIRDMVTRASGQTPSVGSKDPSANGPDWLPQQSPLPYVR